MEIGPKWSRKAWKNN